MTWGFDRYVNGRLMAEGIVIERAENLEQAMTKAWSLCPSPREGTVLLLRPAQLSPRRNSTGRTMLISFRGGEAYVRADWAEAELRKCDDTIDALVEALESCVTSLEFAAGELAGTPNEKGEWAVWSHPAHSLAQARTALAKVRGEAA